MTEEETTKEEILEETEALSMYQQPSTENPFADTLVRTGTFADTLVRTGTFGDAPWTLDKKGTLTIGRGSYHGRFRGSYANVVFNTDDSGE